MVEEEKLILVRYGEIALKSSPVRRQQEKMLQRNIKIALDDAGVEEAEVKRERGRIFVHIDEEHVEDASGALERVFGIVSFSPCWHLPTAEIPKIQNFVKENYEEWVPKGKKFAVRGHRVGNQDVEEEYTSMDLAKRIGDVVDRDVDLDNPDVEIFAEVRGDDSYIYTEVIDGPGGMPVGSAGKVIVLMSGGIDSPVAAWMMMKRGCEIIALYADNWPYIDDREGSIRRVKDVIDIMQKWSYGWDIPTLSFEQGKNLQYFISSGKVPNNLTCLLCKRTMYMVANEVAEERGAKAIVSGESLAQVASQTLENMVVIDEASSLPVFRPLIGMDKQESIDIAKRIGTYEASISIDGICGAVPESPRTKGRLDIIKEIESELSMDKVLRESVKSLNPLI